MEPVTAVIIHAPSVLDLSSGGLLQQLHWGGIATGILLEATDAKVAQALQQLIAAVDPSADLLQVACQTGNVAIALRSMIQQLGSQPPSTCVVAASHHINRLGSLVPDCNLCSVGSNAALQANAAWGPRTTNVLEVTDMREVLRSIVWSHAGDGASFVVAVAMKHSRAVSLTKRGFFPLKAVDGMSFLPLDLSRDIAGQGPFAAILHKVLCASEWRGRPHSVPLLLNLSHNLFAVGEQGQRVHRVPPVLQASDMLEMTDTGVPEFSLQFRKVIEYQSRNRGVPFLDPLQSVEKVLDRIALLHILQSIPPQCHPTANLRAPRFLKVSSADEWAGMADTCQRAGIALPCLVKPAAACGISTSHAMSVVIKPEAWPSIHSMLPAVVQEFVDHAAVLFKVYVIASEVHLVQKESFPDLGHLPKVCLDTMSASIPFDSLAETLPDELKVPVQAPKRYLNRQLVEWGADWLQCKLGLSIFGFDVVVDQHTGDHVIIDVNYFPSFKEVSDAPAKLRMGILQAFSDQHKETDLDGDSSER